MPAGFICLPAPSPSTGQYTCTTEPPTSSPRLSSSLPSFLSVVLTLSFPSFLLPPPSFLTSLTLTHWSLCHFLNNDPGAEGTTAYLYFIMLRPSPADLTDQAVFGGGGLKESERERSSRGGFAQGAGEGGGCSSIMTDRSTDVTIRAQSKHINDQPMVTLSHT